MRWAAENRSEAHVTAQDRREMSHCHVDITAPGQVMGLSGTCPGGRASSQAEVAVTNPHTLPKAEEVQNIDLTYHGRPRPRLEDFEVAACPKLACGAEPRTKLSSSRVGWPASTSAATSDF